MKVGKQFNTLTYGEYLHLIENHQKFTDFNTLGLFRSIVETTKLSLEQKLELRQVAVAAFAKTFDFLQLKDPLTYFEVNTLGENLTKADENKAWEDIKFNQQKIWKNKKLRHRNFGTYSKHVCGYDTCPLNGLMIREGSKLSYPMPHHHNMPFYTDRRNSPERKAEMRIKDRKSQQQYLARRMADE